MYRNRSATKVFKRESGPAREPQTADCGPPCHPMSSHASTRRNGAAFQRPENQLRSTGQHRRPRYQASSTPGRTTEEELLRVLRQEGQGKERGRLVENAWYLGALCCPVLRS